MSAFFAVLGVIVAIVLVFVFAGAVVCWRVGRVLQRSLHRGRTADVGARTGLPPAAPDNQPGVNLADHDECALILNATNELEAQLAAGLDRLLDAIHEHRKEQEG